MKKDSKITKQMAISKVIKKHPQVEEILFTYGLHCMGCVFSVDETIENGAKAHGLSDEEIDDMVDVINEFIKL